MMQFVAPTEVHKMQIDLITISTIIGMGSVLIGVIVSILSIRRFSRERKLSIFLEFHKLLYDKEFIQDVNEIQSWKWKHVGEFFAKYGPEADAEAFSKWIRVDSYFDGISTLVHKKFIDADFIPESTAVSFIRHYELVQPTMEEFAMVYRRPNCFDSVKHLYGKLQKIDYQYDREGYEKLLKKYAEENEEKQKETTDAD